MEPMRIQIVEFLPCPDCGGTGAEWYNRKYEIAVCEDCGQFLTKPELKGE